MKRTRATPLFKKIIASLEDEKKQFLEGSDEPKKNKDEEYKKLRDQMLGHLYEASRDIDARALAGSDEILREKPGAIKELPEDTYQHLDIMDRDPMAIFGYKERAWKEFILGAKDRILRSSTVEDLAEVRKWMEANMHPLFKEFEDGVRAPTLTPKEEAERKRQADEHLRQLHIEVREEKRQQREEEIETPPPFPRGDKRPTKLPHDFHSRIRSTEPKGLPKNPKTDDDYGIEHGFIQ